ncbi:MAG TPA: hypothetical protein PKE45_21910 [Caldilineaceae bacterium]|nr:hypothetical protein [Caldilineaceae bacterium]
MAYIETNDWTRDIPRLLELLRPGESVRLNVGPRHAIKQVAHIRAVVDDTQIVFRVWNRRRRVWDYRVEHLYYFWLLANGGHMRRRTL